jgi:hypothetical protein
VAAYFLNPGSGSELTIAYHLCEGHLAAGPGYEIIRRLLTYWGLNERIW